MNGLTTYFVQEGCERVSVISEPNRVDTGTFISSVRPSGEDSRLSGVRTTGVGRPTLTQLHRDRGCPSRPVRPPRLGSPSTPRGVHIVPASRLPPVPFRPGAGEPGQSWGTRTNGVRPETGVRGHTRVCGARARRQVTTTT